MGASSSEETDYNQGAIFLTLDMAHACFRHARLNVYWILDLYKVNRHTHARLQSCCLGRRALSARYYCNSSVMSVLRWTENNKDLLALGLSLVAILLTLLTVYSVKKQARRDSYMRLHETLVSPSAAEGRRLLFLAYAAQSFPLSTDPTWDKINQSLALYDSAGLYVRHGLIPRRLFLEAWHHPIRSIEAPTIQFLTHARQNSVDRTWVSLDLLFRAARKYQSRSPCCK